MHFVIPAKAGIQPYSVMALQQELDPGFRRDDGMKEC